MLNNNIALQVKDLTAAYDSKPILWDINMDIPKGKMAAIVGPNGAGKTTLLKAMLGLLKPLSGSVSFSCHTHNVAYVPQRENVDWDFPATVLDIVLMGRYGRIGWFLRPNKTDRGIAYEMLRKVGMQDYEDRPIRQLSGGQQQRVFLARALAQEADIYLMDEPFKGVDQNTELAILSILKALKESGKTLIIVHHDLQTIAEYFDWVTLINHRVVASGPIPDVFFEENLTKTYRTSSSLLKEAV